MRGLPHSLQEDAVDKRQTGAGEGVDGLAVHVIQLCRVGRDGGKEGRVGGVEGGAEGGRKTVRDIITISTSAFSDRPG